MMNGWRTGDERRSSMKECVAYGARSRSEDDETLIKVNELPELPGKPPVTLCQETEGGRQQEEEEEGGKLTEEERSWLIQRWL